MSDGIELVSQNVTSEKVLGRIAFQESVLKDISYAIQKEREKKKFNQDILRKRFIELRDETSGVRSQSGEQDTDLPMLFEQMHYQLSLAARRPEPLPSSDSPYFAHIQVREGHILKDYLLGYRSFLSSYSKIPVIDWRQAPLARIFFEYREGDEYEVEIHGKIRKGDLIQRNIVTIQKGSLLGLQFEGHKLIRDDSEHWVFESAQILDGLSRTSDISVQCNQSLLSGGNLSALLDKDQYELLQACDRSVLLVIGGAGSGKTTVALHRLAQLHFLDQLRYSSRNMMMIVPTEGLNHLCQILLRRLGMEGIPVMTFDSWMNAQRKKYLKGLPKTLCDETPPEVSRFKRMAGLSKSIDFYSSEKMKKNPEWINENTILKDRFEFFTSEQALLKAFENPEERPARALVQMVIKHTLAQHSKSSDERFQGADPEKLKTLDGKPLDWATPDEIRGTIDIEDFPVLFEILDCKKRAKKAKNLKFGQYTHLILDEAQELAPIELKMIGRSLPKNPSVTIAGDAAQSMDQHSVFKDWNSSLSSLGVDGQAEVSELKTNYRMTRPVSELAQMILSPLNILLPDASREGAPVRMSFHEEQGQADIQLIESISDLMTRERFCSVAIILRSPEGALNLYQRVSDHIPVRLISDGNFSFTSGVDITSVDCVRGLEFDYVIIADANSGIYTNDPHSRKSFYVAISRSAHQLWIMSVGRKAPFLNV